MSPWHAPGDSASKRALIVGGSLLADGGFTHTFNSHDFHELRGVHFNEIVCAGISSLKWIANREPERDLAAIDALLSVLEPTRADRFTLISTEDACPDTSLPLDESAVLDGLANQAYGTHRLRAERFVTDHFPGSSIVRRLPRRYRSPRIGAGPRARGAVRGETCAVRRGTADQRISRLNAHGARLEIREAGTTILEAWFRSLPTGRFRPSEGSAPLG